MPMRSLMVERLHRETLAYHADADQDLDVLFRPNASSADYVMFLMRVHGFEVPLEASLAMTPGLDLLVDLRARARSAALASDLLHLGLRPRQLAELPHCLTVPQFRSPAEALGWLYVVERATLAHGVVRNHLATRIPGEIASASAYLSTYAGVAGTRWRELGATLDRVAHHPAIGDRIVSAACDAFRCQRRWLRQDHRPAPTSTARAAG